LPIGRGGDSADLRVMSTAPSALNSAALARARGQLKPPLRRERVWRALAAAGLLALVAVAFATAMLMAPPLVSEHTAHRAPD
jgi:hypothetical protein